MTNTTNSAEIRELYNKVQKMKVDISNAERGIYVTNGEFKFGANQKLIDIKTEKDPEVLVSILEFLLGKSTNYGKASEMLGVSATPFKWMGASLDQWTGDLKTRLTQLQIIAKKADLKRAEDTLFAISPELVNEVKLEAVKALLN